MRNTTGLCGAALRQTPSFKTIQRPRRRPKPQREKCSPATHPSTEHLSSICFAQSRQRQLADTSSPFYTRTNFARKVPRQADFSYKLNFCPKSLSARKSIQQLKGRIMSTITEDQSTQNQVTECQCREQITDILTRLETLERDALTVEKIKTSNHLLLFRL